MTLATLEAKPSAGDRFALTRAAWRSILVHVQPEAEAQPRLQAAAGLAQDLDATLIGVAAEMIPPMVTSDPYGMIGGEFIGALMENLQTNLNNAHAAFEAAAGKVTREWLAIQEPPSEAIERIARGADLVVTGGCPIKDRDTSRWADPAELAIKAGRPVLVVPPGGGSLAARSIVVAWKDSRESRRALADAMPLLSAAEEVTLVEASAEPDLEILEAHHQSLRDHLQRHGVSARSRILPAKAHEAAQVLQAAASAAGADLIVAGAYGHTRFGEWAFGGVTSELLLDPQRFLLLSH